MIQNVTVEQIIFSPESNIEAFIIENINRSQHTLKIMAFWFTWAPIADAIVKAHNRGVDVQMILDSRSTEKKEKDVHDLEIEVVPYFVKHQMKDSIKIYDGELFHYKVFMYDNTYVVNGSCNLFNASLNRHEENYMLLASKKLYEAFDAQFKKLWSTRCTPIG